MHARRVFVLLLALGLAPLAGCFSDEPEEADSEEPPIAQEPPDNRPKPFSFPAAAGGSDPGYESPMSSNIYHVIVPEGTERLRVEAEWTCPTQGEDCQLQLHLRDPTGALVAEETGEGGAAVEVDAPAAGEWLASLLPVGDAAGIEGEIRAQLTPDPQAAAGEGGQAAPTG